MRKAFQLLESFNFDEIIDFCITGCHHLSTMKAFRCSPNLIIPAAIIMLLAIPVKAGFKLIDLGTLGGDTSSASAINNQGEIVGYSTSSSGITHAFCYRDGLLRGLNSHPCTANAINDTGQIVGSSLTLLTNIGIGFPLLPSTNIIVPPLTNPIVILPTNIIVNPFTNPIVIPATNIIVPPSTNILIPLTNIATDDPTLAVSSQIVDSSLATNVDTVTNVFYEWRPVLFRQGMLVNLFQGTQNGDNGAALGVNDSDQIVGWFSSTNGIISHAFVYKSGLMTDLGTLGGDTNTLGGDNTSTATAIDNHGEIVGFSSTGTLIPIGDGLLVATHAFLYSNGLMQDLGTLGGDTSEATAINDVGEIVGNSTTTSNLESHPFLYSQGQMYDLGTLGGSQPFYVTSSNQVPGFIFNINTASAINNWGEIVGSAITTNGSHHAFLYSDGTMTDLNNFVRLTDTNGPAGFLSLTTATGINDSGQIIGAGSYWDRGHVITRAFLMEWRPEPRPGATGVMFNRPGAD